MSRLNNVTREAIVNNALNAAGVNDRLSKLKSRRIELAENVRLHELGGVDKHNELIARFQEFRQWLTPDDVKYFDHINIVQECSSDYVSANLGGRAVTLYFDGERSPSNNYQSRVYKKFTTKDRVIVDAGDPIVIEFDEIENEQDAIDQLSEHVTLETTAVLRSVTTIKKLIEVWPEAITLLPKPQGLQSTTLTVNVVDLNKLIGLGEQHG